MKPAAQDIPRLAEDFVRAGLNLQVDIAGSFDHISPTAGLALYRIPQESLTNIAKHAPSSTSTLALTIDARAATLQVINDCQHRAESQPAIPGRGLSGMKQRIHIFGGTSEVGPSTGGWTVCASMSLAAESTHRGGGP